MEWTSLVPIVGFPILRSVGGWLENSLKDGVITHFEWAKLGETIVRVGIIAAGTYYGLNGLGFDVSSIGAGAGAVVLDFILAAISKKKVVEQTKKKK